MTRAGKRKADQVDDIEEGNIVPACVPSVSQHLDPITLTVSDRCSEDTLHQIVVDQIAQEREKRPKLDTPYNGHTGHSPLRYLFTVSTDTANLLPNLLAIMPIVRPLRQCPVTPDKLKHRPLHLPVNGEPNYEAMPFMACPTLLSRACALKLHL